MTIEGVFTVIFLQAEVGIRDLTVTGVQTCALPIYNCYADRRNRLGCVSGTSGVCRRRQAGCGRTLTIVGGGRDARVVGRRRRWKAVRARVARSEERRVGKEGRSRWSADH